MSMEQIEIIFMKLTASCVYIADQENKLFYFFVKQIYQVLDFLYNNKHYAIIRVLSKKCKMNFAWQGYAPLHFYPQGPIF